MNIFGIAVYILDMDKNRLHQHLSVVAYRSVQNRLAGKF